MTLYLIMEGELIIDYYNRPYKVYNLFMKREWASRDCKVVEINLKDLSIIRTRPAQDFIDEYENK